MNCKEIDAELEAYLDGELSSERRAAFHAHAAACGACRSRVERAERLQRTLAALPVPGPSEGFYERALASAAKPRRSQRWVGWAAGIAAAVALLAVVPMLERTAPPAPVSGVPPVTLALNETRTLNLVFSSAEALTDVSLDVELPEGVELAAYPGRREVRWTTALKSGKNVLPLALVAGEGQGGELVATLRHAGTEKTFRVSIAVMPG